MIKKRICTEMITTKENLKEYLRADREALGIKYRRPRFMTDFEWRYEIALRKAEYYNSFRLNLLRYYYLFKLRRLQLKYQTFIPMYTCGKGLSIAHIGGIRVNGMPDWESIAVFRKGLRLAQPMAVKKLRK